jgi:hypothetical protein
MGILDDAIKEHLELKRQHGAAESELEQLEDEAFGAAERPGDEDSAPDPLAEAPTEFMSQPDLESTEPQAEEETAPQAESSEIEEESSRRSTRAEIADLQEPPAMEHEAVSEPLEPSGPSTEEREAIAEQPTEMFDVEEELAAPAEAPSEQDDEEDEDDDFWDEKRLSDELDQALEAPVEDEPEIEEKDGPEVEEEDEPEGEVESAAAQDEDVLEETPDFLEETPEDDQLWFEQKPPKDFDFDD